MGSNLRASSVALQLLVIVIFASAAVGQPTSSPTVTVEQRDFNTTHLHLFAEHPRLHLTEGTFQKWIYNVESHECARRCVSSGNEEPDRFLCKSFEFYPFEDSRPYAPWNELQHNGVCVLNSEDMHSGRMRYEDDGMTDAELLYTSHYTERYASSHFSAIDLARGNNPVLYLDNPERIPIASARNGAVVLSRPKVERRHFHCLASPGESNETVEVFALNASRETVTRSGFVPIDVTTGRCPEKVDKESATAICTRAGAELCTQRELRMLFFSELGCGQDAHDGVTPMDIWAFDALIQNRSETKFVKCCTGHRIAFSCGSYSKPKIDFCSSLKTEEQCVRQGSGFAKQARYGYGLLLNEIRRGCLRDEWACGRTTFSEWSPRDQCVWCGTECRPGSDVGVCPGKDPRQIKRIERFAELFNIQCSPEQACDMATAFPDLGKLLVDPFELPSSGGDVGGTAGPSPVTTIDCLQFKTPEDCLRNYDHCFWGPYHEFMVCRSLDKLNPPSRPPTPRRKKQTKKPRKG